MGLGPTNSWTIDVLMKPLASLVELRLTILIATTTKICTNVNASPAHAEPFVYLTSHLPTIHNISWSRACYE